MQKDEKEVVTESATDLDYAIVKCIFICKVRFELNLTLEEFANCCKIHLRSVPIKTEICSAGSFTGIKPVSNWLIFIKIYGAVDSMSAIAVALYNITKPTDNKQSTAADERALAGSASYSAGVQMNLFYQDIRGSSVHAFQTRNAIPNSGKLCINTSSIYYRCRSLDELVIYDPLW
ncbi:uncharacterized protein V6R79_024256 [Siganus canaliculatus]